jgi:hypothetical protein
MSYRGLSIGELYPSGKEPNREIQSFNEGIQKCIDLIGARRYALDEKNSRPEDGFHYFINQAHIRQYKALEAELEKLKVHL